MRLHNSVCPQHSPTPSLDFSLDGVQESKSSNVSLDIYSIKFKGCKAIYPMKIIKPYNRYKYEEQEEIYNFISDLNNNRITIDAAIMDNLKRAIVKCVKNHASTHPCEYCEATAVKYKDASMSKIQLTWPPSTMNGRHRTKTGLRRILNSIQESEEQLDSKYLKGIKGKSVLFDQENFDFILDMPAEYMHLICLGIVKKMIELTYKVGKKRKRITKRKRSPPKLFNDLIRSVKSPRESSRRVRNLDISTFKAQEYKNILLFYFPIILQNIPVKFKKERQLWLTLVFMIRSCVIPNDEFNNVTKETIFNACELFYNLFHELYGPQNCSYSNHVSSSHLMKIRGNVPLTERSAFPFESFYSEMKNLFNAGTKSTPKQILRNTIMKRAIEPHNCNKSIVYSARKKSDSMEDNSLIYTYNNNEYNFYVITKIEGDEFTCNKQGKFTYHTDLLPNYNWKSVGVFRKGPIGTELIKVNRNEVKGKVIDVLNMVITCPINVLNEK